MKTLSFSASCLLWCLAIGSSCMAQTALPRSTPESQGVSSPGLLKFVQAANSQIDSLHSVMVVRHGKVVAEGWWKPYDAETRHELYSLSKSFTSTAIGLAVAEGKLKLEDEVGQFFPEDMPESPSSQLKSMRVKDLLCMSTGHETEPKVGNSEPWTKTFLNHKVAFKPSTHFLYNTPATYMLSAILQKQTGMTTLEYLEPRLFQPLGITGATWGKSPQGVSLGGYGLNLRTEDIAKFGQLYLQRGQWDGKQIVPAEWIDAATSRQTATGSNPHSDWDQGYGFQFWRCRNGCYRGDGAFGQYCIVIPEHDAVVAITSGVKDMQSVLNLVWNEILPSFQTNALPENTEAQTNLAKALAELNLPLQKGEASSSELDQFSGKKYSLEKNDLNFDGFTVEQAPQGLTLVFQAGDQTQRILCGQSEWKQQRCKLGSLPEQSVAACGAWTAPNVYTAKLCLNETPYCVTMQLKWDGAQLTIDRESNVGFGPLKSPSLVGKR